MDSQQSSIYEASAFSLVESVVEGYNGTVFAYGQTGCGKTFTMMGGAKEEDRGIIPRSFGQVMNIVETTKDKKFLVRVCFLQIYNEQVHDLLSKDVKERKEVKENPGEGFYVKGLNLVVVTSVEQMEAQLHIGFKSRAVAETAMNKESSRSHSIFTVMIESEVDERFTCGKLNFVDLAGSEKQSKTKAEGDRLKEAVKINLSLSTLGNVISSLVDGKTHIPYRVSKLTKLLQDSLGGNTKTIMFANVSPADYNYDETLSTLHYASRAKFIQNKPKINEDPKDAMLRQYAEEIKRLKDMLGKGEGVPAAVQPQKKTKVSQPREKDVRLENELKEKELQFLKEKEAKEEIEAKVRGLEQMLMKGGLKSEGKKKYEELKEKVRGQREEQERLVEEKKRKEEELLNLKSNYKSAKEENEACKKVVQKLRQQIEFVSKEMRDKEAEANQEKYQLLDEISTNEKDFKFYSTLVAQFLRPEQLDIIKSNAEWDDDKKEYRVPPFVLRDKRLHFPKVDLLEGILYKQALANVESEKAKLELVFSKDQDREAPITIALGEAPARRPKAVARENLRPSQPPSQEFRIRVQKNKGGLAPLK